MTATRNEIDLIKADGLRGDNAEARLRFEEQRLGKLGQLFGARENAALYVVGLVLMLVLGLLGGLSIPFLYFSYAYTESFIWFYLSGRLHLLEYLHALMFCSSQSTI